MGLVYGEKYLYGDDLDGNRGIYEQDVTYYSDISGEELDTDDIYLFENDYMSFKELYKLVIDKPSHFSNSVSQVRCPVCNQLINLKNSEQLKNVVTSCYLHKIYCCKDCAEQDLEQYHIKY